MKARFFFPLAAFLAALSLASGAPPNCCPPASVPAITVAGKIDGKEDADKDAPKVNAAHPRGHKNPSAEVLKKRHADAFRRHNHRMKALPEVTPATFDIDALGWGTPVRDQGQCGSCWNVSACDTITAAYVKAGQAKGDGSFEISPQYIMDCENTGGCNGDDAPHVFEIAKTKGIPSERDYGPYLARSTTCKFKAGTTRYAVKDYIFATSGQQYGFATTQEVKNAVVAYGMVSTAIAANSDWDNVGADGTLKFRKLGESDIDHDVNITGWDDKKVIPGAAAPGAFRVKNQWGKGYGQGGYLWVGYGSHAIGFEACAVYVNTPLPPPTPDPTPVPPAPPSGGYTGKIVRVQEYVNGKPAGDETLYLGLPASAVEDYLRDAGFNPAVIIDLLKLAADMRKQPRDWGAILADALKIATDLGLMRAAEEAERAAPVPEPMPPKKPAPEKDSRLYLPRDILRPETELALCA